MSCKVCDIVGTIMGYILITEFIMTIQSFLMALLYYGGEDGSMYWRIASIWGLIFMGTIASVLIIFQLLCRKYHF